MLEIGDKAPAFTLKDGEGHTVSLKDFKGKKVVLFFYPKDNTPGCTKEACAFRDQKSEMVKRGAVVLGVSADSATSHQKFTADHGLNFPLLVDEDRAVMKAYGAYGEKVMYGKKSMGTIRSTFIIDGQGTIARLFPKVSVDGHEAEVLQALEEVK